MQLVCPLCRGSYNGAFRYWGLNAQPGLLRCQNPSCVGRYATTPFPIVLREPGAVIDRLLDLPEQASLSALGMLLKSLPNDSRILEILSRRSTYMWAHYHDLLPESYRPEFVHPAPFPIRALALLDHIEIRPDMRVLVGGCAVGREALEVGFRLRRAIEEAGGYTSLPYDLSAEKPVVAVDIDPALLRMMVQMMEQGHGKVMLRGSADGWHTPEDITLPASLTGGVPLIQPLCADMLDPPFAAESFDLIVALNLLDNVSDPMLLLGQMHALLKEGGHLLLSTPFAWRDDVTPRNARPAAAVRYARRGEIELLQEILTGRVKLSVDFRFRSVAILNKLKWCLRVSDTHLQAFLPFVSLWRKG